MTCRNGRAYGDEELVLVREDDASSGDVVDAGVGIRFCCSGDAGGGGGMSAEGTSSTKTVSEMVVGGAGGVSLIFRLVLLLWLFPCCCCCLALLLFVAVATSVLSCSNKRVRKSIKSCAKSPRATCGGPLRSDVKTVAASRHKCRQASTRELEVASLGSISAAMMGE